MLEVAEVNETSFIVENAIRLPIFIDQTEAREWAADPETEQEKLELHAKMSIGNLTKDEIRDWLHMLFKYINPTSNFEKTKKSNIKFVEIEITPTLARILKKVTKINNTDIRSPRNLKTIEEALTKGTFHLDSGTSIKIDTMGNLCDGTHRLTAVINTGISAVMHICYGVSGEGMLAIDHGKSRSFEDTYKLYKTDRIRHYKKRSIKDEAFILRHEYYFRRFKDNFLQSKSFVNPDITEIWAIHNEDRNLIEEAAESSLNFISLTTKNTMGFCIYHILKKYPNEGRTFFKLLDTQPPFVIFELHKRLSHLKNEKQISKKDSDGKVMRDASNRIMYISYPQILKNEQIIIWTIKAFKYYLSGNQERKTYPMINVKKKDTPYNCVLSL